MPKERQQQPTEDNSQVQWLERLRRHKIVLVLTVSAAVLGGLVAVLDDGQKLISSIGQVSSFFREQREEERLVELVQRADTAYFYDYDLIEAARLYREAAESGSAHAQAAMAKLAFNGWAGVVEDHSQADYWADRAVPVLLEKAGTDPSAAYLLAYLYKNGIGVREDLEEAFNRYRSAADRNYAPAQSNLASFYAIGEFVLEDQEKAFQLQLSAARQGHVVAIHQVGIGYFNGRDDVVERDAAAAVTWLTSAAEKGHTEAQTDLALLYNSIDFGPVDHEASVDWLRRAASAGNARAQYYLGVFLYNGSAGLEVDEEEGARFLQLSASNGNVDAMLRVGLIYIDGNVSSVPEDKEEGVRFLRLAAGAGIVEAQYRLAHMLHAGENLEPDFDEARHWYEECSGEAGGVCTTSLAIMYELGRFGQIDIRQAKSLYEEALELGDENGGYRLARLLLENEDTNDPAVNRRALSLFTRAVELEPRHGYSWYEIGSLFSEGPPGIPQNEVEATQAFLNGAEAGSAPAQLKLGWRYYQGIDTDSDLEVAVHWFVEAAKQGLTAPLDALRTIIEDGEAAELTEDDLMELQDVGLRAHEDVASWNDCEANGLGLRYLNGEWAQKNIAIAERWFLHGAERGSSAAAYNYGRLHVLEEAALPDPESGLRWLQKAADLDFAKAEHLLGLLYFEGRHVERDPERAFYHLIRAKELGEAVDPEIIEKAAPDEIIAAFSPDPGLCRDGSTDHMTQLQ